ncbi:MAG TPA: cytochrome c oxidase assembly protein [Solirubrobacteraceae bacterium]|nr:cytochrome c oxidase assembly protein [Solirubrobacteraceae bacterium]
MSVTETIGPTVITIAVWALYERRCQALAREDRPVPGWRRACFAAGVVVFVAALVPPLGPLSDELLVAHMAEHLLIGDIATLLMVLGLTGPLLGPLLRRRPVARLRVLTHPVVAIVCWAVNFYAWHLPAAYQLALRNEWVHAIQHTTFFIFGACVWMALLGPLPKPTWFNNAGRLVYIIAVRLIGTVLANVMIFSGTFFYPFYRAGDAHWHISPAADQVYAGALMMFEESVLTILLFAWLFMKVAGETEERQALLDYAGAHGIALSEQRAARAVSAGRSEELWERLRAPEKPRSTVSRP